MGVALFRQLVNPGPAGIGKAQHPCRLIEGLARRIVPRLSHQMIFTVVRDPDQMAVSPAHHQAQKGRLQIRIGQEIGADVALNMVHRDQGLVCGESQALHTVNPGQQSPHQSGPIGDCQGVHVPQGHSRFRQGFIDYSVAGFHVGPAGDLRHDASI